LIFRFGILFDIWILEFEIKKMNFKIIAGWLLIVAGLAVIGGAINASYRYFTAKAEFPAVFAISAKSPADDLPPQAGMESLSVEEAQNYLQNQIQYSVNRALVDMLPDDAIAKMLNILSWSIFGTFLVFAGGKVSWLGVQLLSVKNDGAQKAN